MTNEQLFYIMDTQLETLCVIINQLEIQIKEKYPDIETYSTITTKNNLKLLEPLYEFIQDQNNRNQLLIGR